MYAVCILVGCVLSCTCVACSISALGIDAIREARSTTAIPTDSINDAKGTPRPVQNSTNSYTDSITNTTRTYAHNTTPGISESDTNDIAFERTDSRGHTLVQNFTNTLAIPADKVTFPQEFNLDLYKCEPQAVECISEHCLLNGRIVPEKGRDSINTRHFPECYWRIQVADKRYLYAVFELTLDPCDSDVAVTVADSTFQDPSRRVLTNFHCHFMSMVIMAPGNQLFFRWTESGVRTGGTVYVFTLRFHTTSESIQRTLPAVYTTPLTGYITSPGFDGITGAPNHVDCSYYLAVPATYALLYSFPVFDIQDTISVRLVNMNQSLVQGLSTNRPTTQAHVIEGTSVIVGYKTSDGTFQRGFKMLFSFHPSNKVPVIVPKFFATYIHAFNCSVPYYDTFRQHLECNLWIECVGGEDEGQHCPFSPPGCNGSVGYKNKCYTLGGWTLPYFRYNRTSLLPDEAQAECGRLGGDLAMMKNKREWEAFLSILRIGNVRAINILIGMTYFQKPDFYRHAVQWIDGTVSYITNFTFSIIKEPLEKWMYFKSTGHFEIRKQEGLSLLGTFLPTIYMCQFHTYRTFPEGQQNIVLPRLMSRPSSTNKWLTRCPAGHLAHDFLSCDVLSDCGVKQFMHNCDTPNGNLEQNTVGHYHVKDAGMSVHMFVCSDGSTLHYTLVCDFRKDCADGSDEEFCQHQACDGFTCRSAQCVPADTTCDSISNCVDGSDEADCVQFSTDRIVRLAPPALVNFKNDGTITQTKLNTSQPCPQTHFRCPGEYNYCLPVFVRCNGVYDCADHEDEAECHNYTCPGFYRCRASSVCVHLDHLCDGFPQCPQRDDELLCDLTCPEGCRCQGLAFVCSRPFSANTFPELRYLDASGSGMALQDAASNVYLVWLSLASCGLAFAKNVALLNLQTLNLNDNLITSFSPKSIHALRNLRELRLAGNPLTELKTDSADPKHTVLRSVDFSRTLIETLDTRLLSTFTNLQTLNFSYGKLTTVAEVGFICLPKLQKLDIRGSFIVHYPSDVLKGLTELLMVQTENYDLCCKALLPEGFDERFCFAPEDEISSCEDLLRSDVYRIFLWTFTLAALAGNGGSFCFRFFIRRKESRSAFNLFVTNLCCADFLMGVYLCLIGTADKRYLGSYMLHKASWTSSIACKTAGFLSFVSSEVSAFVICLITLDRFIVLRFPFSSLRFSRPSAFTACLIAWLAGAALACLPLLPMTSHWEFYGQTGICLPLPITRKTYQGRAYAFGVMIVFNFVLFLVITAGQASIYWSVRVNSITGTETTKKSQDLTIARRLITVALSNFLCWFPIGLLGMMAAMGVPVSGELNVTLAIFVLPLNSALNPFLYTYNVLVEKQRKAREAQLLKVLQEEMAVDLSS